MNRVGRKLFNDQRGAVNPLLISTILLGVLLVVAVGGFVWSFMEMTDWKNNGQEKIDAAVVTAKEEQQAADATTFQEEEKKPNRVYQGPSDMGSVRFNYPKTWAAYTANSDTNKLEVYFYPLIVPRVQAGVTPYSLRVSVTNQDYASVVKSYESLVSKGEATATTITLATEGSDTKYEGIRVDGQLTKTINGSVVIFKVRDKTLQLFVDHQDYVADFNNTILKSLSFEP